MTIQRITNLHSAPISACLRAFVLAAETGASLNSRPMSRPYSQARAHAGKVAKSAAKFGNKLGMNTANIFKGGNAYVTGFTQGNSATLRGSA